MFDFVLNQCFELHYSPYIIALIGYFEQTEYQCNGNIENIYVTKHDVFRQLNKKKKKKKPKVMDYKQSWQLCLSLMKHVCLLIPPVWLKVRWATSTSAPADSVQGVCVKLHLGDSLNAVNAHLCFDLISKSAYTVQIESCQADPKPGQKLYLFFFLTSMIIFKTGQSGNTGTQSYEQQSLYVTKLEIEC